MSGPSFNMHEDIIARDLATGKAAKEELSRIKDIIKYCAEQNPEDNKVTITFSMAANMHALNFKDLLENYADIVGEKNE